LFKFIVARGRIELPTPFFQVRANHLTLANYNLFSLILRSL
jgi:hypothetical protein